MASSSPLRGAAAATPDTWFDPNQTWQVSFQAVNVTRTVVSVTVVAAGVFVGLKALGVAVIGVKWVVIAGEKLCMGTAGLVKPIATFGVQVALAHPIISVALLVGAVAAFYFVHSSKEQIFKEIEQIDRCVRDGFTINDASLRNYVEENVQEGTFDPRSRTRHINNLKQYVIGERAVLRLMCSVLDKVSRSVLNGANSDMISDERVRQIRSLDEEGATFLAELNRGDQEGDIVVLAARMANWSVRVSEAVRQVKLDNLRQAVREQVRYTPVFPVVEMLAKEILEAVRDRLSI